MCFFVCFFNCGVCIFIDSILVFPCTDFPELSYPNAYDRKSLIAFMFTKKIVKNLISHSEALQRVSLGYIHDSQYQPSTMHIEVSIVLSTMNIVNYCQRKHFEIEIFCSYIVYVPVDYTG